eukprot:862847_1
MTSFCRSKEEIIYEIFDYSKQNELSVCARNTNCRIVKCKQCRRKSCACFNLKIYTFPSKYKYICHDCNAIWQNNNASSVITAYYNILLHKSSNNMDIFHIITLTTMYFPWHKIQCNSPNYHNY